MPLYSTYWPTTTGVNNFPGHMLLLPLYSHRFVAYGKMYLEIPDINSLIAYLQAAGLYRVLLLGCQWTWHLPDLTGLPADPASGEPPKQNFPTTEASAAFLVLWSLPPEGHHVVNQVEDFHLSLSRLPQAC